MITKEQLEKMKARLAGATPGPWKASRGNKEEMEIEISAPKGEPRLGMGTWSGLISVYGCFGEEKGFDVAKCNAEFVASARADMATLIEEVERLQGGGMNDEQPAPIKHKTGKPVWEMVIADMKERNEVGIERYGTALRPFNGRDALKDAYQEALDLAVYLRQLLAEDAAK